jgi:competence ComEA-like helix-hairpin-helix protein
MKKRLKYLLLGAYVLAGTVFCLNRCFAYQNSFETLRSYEHTYVLSSDEEGIRLDLNAATAAQLAALPGLSRLMAERIVSYRQEHGDFTDVTQIAEIEGIPESLAVQLYAYLYIVLPTEQEETAAAVTEPSATITEVIPVETSPTESVTFPLNLNTATETQLTALPGIGEVTARAIVAYRMEIGAFTNRRQLLAVSGIGESKLSAIYDLIYIENEQPETEPVAEPVAEAEISEATQAETDPAETQEIPIINLNTATQQELLLLPECDETLAANILKLRDEDIHEFYNILEILYADGMTDALFLTWQEYLAVDDEGHTEKAYLPNQSSY